MSGELIYRLIPAVMSEIGAVSKDRRNESQKYSFRGIEDFYNAAHPALIKHGVFCVPEVIEHCVDKFERVNEYGKTTTWRHVTIKVRHRFCASDGSYVDVVTMGEGLDNSDKGTNKSMSAAMKYALIELFCVPTQDIEDADKTSPEAGHASATTIVRSPVKEPEPVKVVEVTEEDSFQPEYIDKHQSSYLSRRFRETIVEVAPLREPEASELRHNALSALQLLGTYKSKFVDAGGNPTQEFILKSEYSAVGKALVLAAKSCKQ